jgi:hypothetical protein
MLPQVWKAILENSINGKIITTSCFKFKKMEEKQEVLNIEVNFLDIVKRKSQACKSRVNTIPEAVTINKIYW